LCFYDDDREFMSGQSSVHVLFFLFPRSSIYLYLFANRIEQMVGMYGNEQSP